MGAAVISEDPTLLICGDLSFFYDSNGLWNDKIPAHFRIIILNNEGGGIFRILPGNKESENFEKYFETVHHMNTRPIANLYNLDYLSAHSTEEISENLKGFYTESARPKILEIFTPRTLNDKVLLEYFGFMKD